MPHGKFGTTQELAETLARLENDPSTVINLGFA